jgi:hypothetical protein
VGVRTHRQAEGAREPKVGQLDLAGGVDEQVLGLEVPVEHPALVAVVDPLEQLPQVGSYRRLRQPAAGRPALRLDRRVVVVHQLLQVHVQVLEGEVELALGVDDVQQQHHGRVVKLLQDRDFPGAKACIGRITDLMAVEGTPSVSVSRRIILRATLWLDRVSTAL